MNRSAPCLHGALVALALAPACADPVPGLGELPPAGGATTTTDRTSSAYENPAPNLSDEDLALHFEGDVAFEQVFVSAPAEVNPGLGPVFNHTSCVGCHVRNGRGLPVAGQGPLGSPLLVRVSLPPDMGTPEVPGGAVPVPGIGTQIGDHAIYGQEPEASVRIEWEEVAGEYADGTPYSLRRPRLEIALPGGEPLPDEVMLSARTPPPVFGLGLLEAVPEEDILALADPDDADGDGISGRANYVWSLEHEAEMLGRFGVKANTPTLLQQTAGAYADDMGVSSPLIPDPDGSTDIAEEILEAAAIYTQTLAVPRRRASDDPQVQRGEELFVEAGCDGCHVPVLRTGSTHRFAALHDQEFAPFTDLLLHDMGEGLADGRPDFLASGSEWRTAPLWGLGLVARVMGAEAYLHDGRARTLAEAILWHGGEGERSREAFRTMPASEREALLAFLRTL